MRWTTTRISRAPSPRSSPLPSTGLQVANLEVVYHSVVLVLKGVSLEVPDGGYMLREAIRQDLLEGGRNFLRHLEAKEGR